MIKEISPSNDAISPSALPEVTMTTSPSRIANLIFYLVTGAFVITFFLGLFMAISMGLEQGIPLALRLSAVPTSQSDR